MTHDIDQHMHSERVEASPPHTHGEQPKALPAHFVDNEQTKMSLQQTYTKKPEPEDDKRHVLLKSLLALFLVWYVGAAAISWLVYMLASHILPQEALVGFSEETTFNLINIQSMIRLLLTVLAIGCAIWLLPKEFKKQIRGRKRYVKTVKLLCNPKRSTQALKLGRYPLILSSVPLCMVLFLMAAITYMPDLLQEVSLEGQAIPTFQQLAEGFPGLLVGLFQLAIFCLAVGLLEEGLFRVLLLSGQLYHAGKTRKGLFAVLIVHALVFGLFHVDSWAFNDPLVLAQALMKTLQAGMIGFVLASIYLRTRSYLGVAILHAGIDFLLIASDSVLNLGSNGSVLTTTYVVEENAALAIDAMNSYLIAIVCYIPPVIMAIRALRTHQVPDRGLFAPSSIKSSWYGNSAEPLANASQRSF